MLVASQVGFSRTLIPSGFSTLANQFETPDSRISSLWPAQSAPDIWLYKFDSGRQVFDINTTEFGSWDYPSMSLAPGEGVVVRNYSSPKMLTLLGTVWQGFNVHLPRQFALIASPVPQSGMVSFNLAFPYGQVFGDKIYRMVNTAGDYQIFTSTGSGWNPAPEPTLRLNEAFWSYRAGWQDGLGAANNWSRVFWSWP